MPNQSQGHVLSSQPAGKWEDPVQGHVARHHARDVNYRFLHINALWIPHCLSLEVCLLGPKAEIFKDR